MVTSLFAYLKFWGAWVALKTASANSLAPAPPDDQCLHVTASNAPAFKASSRTVSNSASESELQVLKCVIILIMILILWHF